MIRNRPALIVALAMTSLIPSALAEDEQRMTPGALRAAIDGQGSGDVVKLVESARSWFGAEALAKGAPPKIAGLETAWGIEAPGAAKAPQVVAGDGSFVLNLSRLGTSDVYAGAASLPEGAAFLWWYEVDGKKIGGGKLEVYATRPENVEHPGVPKGELKQQPALKCATFAGTTRDWWVYVPAQYKAETAACVMFFEDGGGMKNYIPTVFDNLIARGEMPVTVGVFINPGVFAEEKNRSNRSFEYDTLSDQYARLLLDEILPAIEGGELKLNLRKDAAGRAICGISSGGICSFTAAWERPDQFSKVLSIVGSFTDIASGASKREGGHNYPALIRKTPRKPIRVFLQDGANDLDNEHGNWPLANQEMARALQFAGYDCNFVFGRGFHSDQHGRAIMADALRWLWRE